MGVAPSTAKSFDRPVVEMLDGGVELIESLAGEWRRLCDEGPNDQPFYRPEWLAAHISVFEPKTKLLIITARVQGRLQAVLPLIKDRIRFNRLPVARVLSGARSHSMHIPGRYDLVRSTGSEGDDAVRAIWNFLGRLPGWDIIKLPMVPEGGAAEQLVMTARSSGCLTGYEESILSPFLPLSGYEDTQDPLSLVDNGNLKKELRKKKKRLEQTGEVRLVRIGQPQRQDVERYFEFELASWKGRSGTGVASNKQDRQFYDAITREAMEFSYLTLYFLEQGDRTVAARLSLTYRNRLFLLECAYSDAFAQYSPGSLLFSDVLRDCVRQGLSEIDFTGKWTDFTSHWTKKARRYANHYIFRKSIYGFLLEKAKFRIKPFIRKMRGSMHLRRHESAAHI